MDLGAVFGAGTVLVGTGNILRGDDAFGPELVKRLSGREGLECVDAGTTPENHIGSIAKRSPSIVVIADAAHMGLCPGEIRLLVEDEIARAGLTTHDMSCAMFMEQLRDRTGARLYMLAVQPVSMGFGSPMSPEVSRAVDIIAAGIESAL